MNLPDLLDELRIPFRRHGESPHVSEGWIGLECPFCGRGTGRYGLGVNLRSGRVSCWKCGGHSLAAALAEITGQDSKTIRPQLAGLDRFREAPLAVSGKLELPGGLTELGAAHRDYLAGRGFDPDELVERWKIQAIGLAARLAWRIFIPIHRQREVVSWTTRAVSDAVPHTDRYRGAKRTQEAIPKHRLLYGEDLAGAAAVVVEGPTDVWAIGPGAVCTCGVGFSPAQTARLARFSRIAVCFDSDRAAQRRARALADQLAMLGREVAIVRLDAKDAAVAMRESPGELRELRTRFLE